MKKIIAAVLSICVVLCAAGCGNEIAGDTEIKSGLTAESKTQTSAAAQTTAGSASDPVTTTTESEETSEEMSFAAEEDPDMTDTSSKLYYIPDAADFYDTEMNRIGTIDADSYYAGHYDPDYEGYVVIKYRYREYLVADSCVEVQENAKILETAAIGQMGGDIYGKKACGPTSATILVKFQLGLKWTKDELILFCEENKLNDQGSLRQGGGITATNLMKLIESYSDNTIKASNVYGSDPSTILKDLIDNGDRSIVVAHYLAGKIVTKEDSPAHFVVICGYEYTDGELYFYYADPYFGDGGRSLMKVSAETLAESMDNVTKEPKCIITVTSIA